MDLACACMNLNLLIPCLGSCRVNVGLLLFLDSDCVASDSEGFPVWFNPLPANVYFWYLTIYCLFFWGGCTVSLIVKDILGHLETLTELDEFIEILVGRFIPLHEQLLLPLARERELQKLGEFISWQYLICSKGREIFDMMYNISHATDELVDN